MTDMQESLAGRTILMSGGSRGIGLAIALRAAKDGANIALLAKTNTPHPRLEGTIHTAAEQIHDAGGQALAIVGDVRNETDIARAVSRTREHFGGIDIVINNASVIDLSGSLDLSAKKYDLMQDVNVRGTFLLTRAAIPSLKKSVNPHVLSLSPPLRIIPEKLRPHPGYSLAKFGMTIVTLGIAAEFAGYRIAANTLWPRTTIATAAVQNILGGDRIMALSRTPQIYADAAHHVLTRPSRVTTGQTLIVEDILADAGITDLATYAATPGTRDNALNRDFFLT